MKTDLFDRTDWVATYSGYAFFPLEPKADGHLAACHFA